MKRPEKMPGGLRVIIDTQPFLGRKRLLLSCKNGIFKLSCCQRPQRAFINFIFPIPREILRAVAGLPSDLQSHLIDAFLPNMPNSFRTTWFPLSSILPHLQCLPVPFLEVRIFLINILLKRVFFLERHCFVLGKRRF